MNLDQFYECLPEPGFRPPTQRCAVLVLDTCGFTKIVEAEGILSALRRIQLIHAVVLPVLETRGRLLKRDADNLFAVFDSVTAAKQAARWIHSDLQVFNSIARVLPLRVSIGIGFGEVIMLDSEFFGLEVNLASKLGEDTALARETLFTEAAKAQLEKE
jgi:adenylate cyclase